MFICILLSQSIKAAKVMPAPKLHLQPQVLIKHGHKRIDPYFNAKDRDDKKIIDYLLAENKYATKTVKDLTGNLQNNIFKELKSRVKKNSNSVPYQLGDYHYFYKYKSDKEYRVHYRYKKNKKNAVIFLDENNLAKKHKFFKFSKYDITNNNHLMAYATDTIGRRKYSLYVRNLQTKKDLGIIIKDMTGNFVWANDNKTIFYSQQDPKTLRWDKIYKFNIKTKKTVLVYAEKDNKFDVWVTRSKTKKHIFITSKSSEASEFQYIDADKPNSNFVIFHKRQTKHLYEVYDGGDFFYILSNYKSLNFKIFKVAKNKHKKMQNWKTYIPHHAKTYIVELSPFRDFLVAKIRSEGIDKIRVIENKTKRQTDIPFAERVYTSYIKQNPQFDTEKVRIGYESMVTPTQIYDYNMRKKNLTLLKQEIIPGGFDRTKYATTRMNIPARDKTLIPVTLLYKKSLNLKNKNPLLLYGYGSYGHTIKPYFDQTKFSLVDRGFIYAIAHVRGGAIKGRKWYLAGKYLQKKNTFFDFIDVAKNLVKNSYTTPEKLFAMGSSAGGLLIGSVINQRPDLFKAVVAGVPFVDVVTTMLDDSLPLTTSEYEEWGNPNIKKYYDYMLSYSPYDNIKKQKYPAILATSGLHDSQVQYWEPTKWIAKLRDHDQSNQAIILKTEMSAGHGGKSGRYRSLEELAFNYAFLLSQLTAKPTVKPTVKK